MGYRHLIQFLFLCFSFGAQAQTFGVHTFSLHERPGMNNTNPGVYVRFDNGATVGTYFNSHRKQSTYAGWSFETDELHSLSAAVTVGVVTGYSQKVSALLVPSIALHTSLGTARIGIVPRPPVRGGCGAVHLMLERHF
jgi:hypothetical protein